MFSNMTPETRGGPGCLGDLGTLARVPVWFPSSERALNIYFVFEGLGGIWVDEFWGFCFILGYFFHTRARRLRFSARDTVLFPPFMALYIPPL